MSDAQRAVEEDGEAPVNPYSLLEAVNASSASVHTGWLLFVAGMIYLLVAVAGVTHRDLLLARDIPLPILQVGIELTRFFVFAPIVLVLLHIGLMTQLVTLARKAHELDRALRMVEATDRRTHPLRLELHHFFFVQAIAGPDRSRILNGLLHGLTWLTVVVLPVLLLLYVQLAFLPYHDEAITWTHRVTIGAAVAFLCLVGVFIAEPYPSLGRALWRTSLAHPLTVLATVVVLAGVGAFSLLAATFPGERAERIAREIGIEPLLAPLARRDDRLLGLFPRSLHVTDHDLVVDRSMTPGEATLNLRHRDLRLARLDRTDLQQADLTGANLDGASLVGANLRGALVQCADLDRLVLEADRRAAACASARGARLTRARLTEASLAGIDLTGARLEEADLTGAVLSHARLAGASLYGAQLERADLTGGVGLEGANLAAAAAQGVDLTGARLDGADLTGAALQGAVLEFASLVGAQLADADLEGASLYRARLIAADLGGAGIRGASLREAAIWRARAPEAQRSELSDLTGLRSEPPPREEIAALEAELQRLADAGLASRLAQSVAGLLKTEAPPALPAATDPRWADVVRASLAEGGETRFGAYEATSAVVGAATAIESPAAPGDPAGSAASGVRGTDRRARVTRHLVGLACQPRWAAGAVATGLGRRALGAGFNGDVAAFYESLRRPECPASRTMARRTLARLGAAAEAARGR